MTMRKNLSMMAKNKTTENHFLELHPVKDAAENIFKTDEDILNDVQESNVSDEEKKLLRDAAAYNSSEEENELKDAVVDSVDEDNEPLNENINYKDLGAKDLDIPDDFEDDDDEELEKE